MEAHAASLQHKRPREGPGGAPTPALSTPIGRTKSAAVLCRAPLRLCPCLCVFVIGLPAPVGTEQRLSLSTGALPTSENLAPHSSRSRRSAGRSAATASETETATASVGPFREPARSPPSARALCCALLSFSGLRSPSARSVPIMLCHDAHTHAGTKRACQAGDMRPRHPGRRACGHRGIHILKRQAVFGRAPTHPPPVHAACLCVLCRARDCG